MSEQGWRRFLAAEGVADWVVLHGGAMAVFRVPSLAEAARLAEAVAQISGLDGALMTLTDGQLTVRLTRGVFRLEERHVEMAQAVSAVAREHGATADRTLAQEVSLAIAAQPDAIDVGFWRAVLGYAELADDNAVDPLGHGSTVWMQSLDPAKPPASRDARRRIRRPRTGRAAPGRGSGSRRPHRRRFQRPRRLDPRRPRRQPCLHRRLAGWRLPPGLERRTPSGNGPFARVQLVVGPGGDGFDSVALLAVDFEPASHGCVGSHGGHTRP